MAALVRGRLRDLSIVGLVHGSAGLRSAPDADVTTATKLALRSLAGGSSSWRPRSGRRPARPAFS
jgi:hypothetical protein